MLNNLIAYLSAAFAELKDREEGQGMVEYSLILALISIAAILLIPQVGDAIVATFTDVVNAF